jgi:septum formation protein
VPDQVDPADVNEAPLRREMPAALAMRLARAKGDAVAARHSASFVVAADTVVACGRRVLPKAENEAEARACLELLSGRRHNVHGGISVRAPDGRSAHRRVATAVLLKRLTEDEIAGYLASGEWHGKAGGYAIQGRAAAFIRAINGSYGNVVGLDLFSLAQMLRGLGFRF